MTTTPHPTRAVLRTDYQRAVAAYWDTHVNHDVNLALGDIDELYHHHYGIGTYDPTVLDTTAPDHEQKTVRELHRLESAQADLLLDHLGPLTPEHRLLDAGSGRGGTSFMAHRRYRCHVDGVSISQYQVDFANAQARRHDHDDKVRFHFRNMLDTGLEAGSRQAVWTNETTMYVDLDQAFAEFARILTTGGRYVCITGGSNDLTGGRSQAVSRIDTQYTCNIHPRSAYFKALNANGLVPITVTDPTPLTLPCWELRARSHLATGIEQAFLTAYREDSFHYLLITADRT
ncbi:geranyl diphosphate 2-C-methyltransferase [Streptomyces violascens]|uniref:geranyl diphosphate 2-C-methyltransferase n=1 Tax=Streptomyces violascens TaxID=67381 RepID=UPI0036B02CA3